MKELEIKEEEIAKEAVLTEKKRIKADKEKAKENLKNLKNVR